MPARRSSPARSFDIVVIGGANTDYLVRAPRLPKAGETVQGDTFEAAEAGGKGTNQAVAAARLGARVAFVARVGADERGKALCEKLKREGIDVSRVSIDPRAATGVALINVDAKGEKQIVAAPGANQRLTAADVQRAADLIRGAGALVLQFEVPMRANLAAAKIARDAGVPVLLDAAPAASAPAALLRLVTIIRANEHEAQALAGLPVRDRKTARLAGEGLLNRGPRVAILAAGGGNLLLSRGESACLDELWLPKLPVKAIDATGAGDAFMGALAFAVMHGHALSDAATFANAAGALATTKLGAQPGLPTLSAVSALLRKAGLSGIAIRIAANRAAS